MKKVFIFCSLIALVLQSCLKVEELDKVCKPLPPKPDLIQEGDTIVVNTGGYFNATIGQTKYLSGYEYHWSGPNNYNEDNGTGDISLYINSTTQAGTYTVVYRNTETDCVSEKASVVVVVETPTISCNMSTNTYTLGGTNPIYTVSDATGILNGNYYFITWNISSTTAVTVRFGLKPSTATKTYTIVDVSDPQTLGNNESEITYKTGTNTYFNALSGSVKTSYVNGKYKVEFCEISMKQLGVSSYVHGSKANLLYQ